MGDRGVTWDRISQTGSLWGDSVDMKQILTTDQRLPWRELLSVISPPPRNAAMK